MLIKKRHLPTYPCCPLPNLYPVFYFVIKQQTFHSQHSLLKLVSCSTVLVMDLLLKNLIKLSIYTSTKLEKLFGLSPNAFKWKSSLEPDVFCFNIKFAVVFSYPVACAKILRFVIPANSKTTVFARNIFLSCNWAFLILVYANESLDLHEKYQTMLKLFHSLVRVHICSNSDSCFCFWSFFDNPTLRGMPKFFKIVQIWIRVIKNE